MLVAGTGTEVGKTWVSARLLDAWRSAGLEVAARKLAQSFAPGDGPTDSEVLAEASGEKPEAVCPAHRCYEVPLSPPMAAESLGRPVPKLAELLGELRWPRARRPGGVGRLLSGAAVVAAQSVGLVETAGGVRSPQAADADVVDLAAALGPDAVVLVADAGLGTINSVRLCMGALAARAALTPASEDASADAGADPPLVVLNRFDASVELHRRNRAWLAGREEFEVYDSSPASLGDLASRLSR